MGLAKIERERAARGEGCLGRAADDEPVFVLRGQDRFAPQLVREWANLAQLSLGTEHPKVREARALAALMESWTPRKHPD